MKRLVVVLAVLGAGVPSAAGAAPGRRVYVRNPIAAGAQYLYRPASLGFGGASFTHLHPWRGWNTHRAVAHGRIAANDCDPSCAAGHISHARVTLVLSRVARRAGRLTYGCIAYRAAPPLQTLHAAQSPADGGPCPRVHRRCRGSFLGHFYRGLLAANVGCDRARRVAGAWVHRYGHAQRHRIVARVRGWACLGIRHPANGGDDSYRNIRCARRNRRIFFYGAG